MSKYIVLIISLVVLGRQGRNELADLRHKEHLQDDHPHDINMDLLAPVNDEDDDNSAWEDVVDAEEESLVYVIRDILGAQ